MQFQSFERNFEKLKCSSNRSNPNANHLNANLRWLWWPRSTLRHRVWSATEPHLFRAMAALCLHYVCTMSTVSLHSFRSISAAIPQSFRIDPPVLPVFRIVSALFPRSFCGIPAPFPQPGLHCSHSSRIFSARQCHVITVAKSDHFCHSISFPFHFHFRSISIPFHFHLQASNTISVFVITCWLINLTLSTAHVFQMLSYLLCGLCL